jgi:hypothetical protein
MFMQSNCFAEEVDLDWVFARAMISTLRGLHTEEGGGL